MILLLAKPCFFSTDNFASTASEPWRIRLIVIGCRWYFNGFCSAAKSTFSLNSKLLTTLCSVLPGSPQRRKAIQFFDIRRASAAQTKRIELGFLLVINNFFTSEQFHSTDSDSYPSLKTPKFSVHEVKLQKVISKGKQEHRTIGMEWPRTRQEQMKEPRSCKMWNFSIWKRWKNLRNFNTLASNWHGKVSPVRTPVPQDHNERMGFSTKLRCRYSPKTMKISLNWHNRTSTSISLDGNTSP